MSKITSDVYQKDYSYVFEFLNLPENHRVDDLGSGLVMHQITIRKKLHEISEVLPWGENAEHI